SWATVRRYRRGGGCGTGQRGGARRALSGLVERLGREAHVSCRTSPGEGPTAVPEGSMPIDKQSARQLSRTERALSVSLATAALGTGFSGSPGGRSIPWYIPLEGS